MLKYAIIFAIISLIAGALGFGGVAAGAAGIAKVLFGLFLILAVVFLVLAALGVGAAKKALDWRTAVADASWYCRAAAPAAQRGISCISRTSKRCSTIEVAAPSHLRAQHRGRAQRCAGGGRASRW